MNENQPNQGSEENPNIPYNIPPVPVEHIQPADNPDVFFIRADTGKRFANYLIDLVLFYVLAIFVGIVIGVFNPDYILSEPTAGEKILDRILSLLAYAVYMGFVEGIFSGKSLGKLITGTRAVYTDGYRISFGVAFSRGFSRAVPFCVFSAFGNPCNPWQDRWTNTMVIDEKKSTASVYE